jgi:hypothetical protein
MRTARKKVALAAVTTMAASVSIAVAALTGASASAAPVAPAATTGTAVATSTSSEALLGTVNPNGSGTRYYFQYGTSTAYGATTPANTAGAGASPVQESDALNGLTPGTVYHYRLVAVSPAGTVDGADATFTSGGTSVVSVLGHEGFVSPGGVIGIQIGCFNGVTTCTGSFTVTHGATLVGEHDFTIAPESGGFHNFKLTQAGETLLAGNRVNALLGVTVTVKDSDGQTVQFVIHLARWVWH